MTHVRGHNTPLEPTLPWASQQYDHQQMNRMVQVLQQWMQQIGQASRNPTFINVVGMPLRGDGLPVGTVYIDSDVLRVVVANAVYAPSYLLTMTQGTMDWTIA